ncbi:MAG: phage terminase large subunit [Phycisphaeraceae bacterium]|nr:phage terminase large subunit [Phycisphaeraceae bacterium]
MRVSRVRRERARLSPIEFLRIYLPSYAQQPFSRMHIEMGELIVQASERRGARVAIAAPRGHAKSTVVTLATILWCIVFKLEDYILLVCDSQDQAVGHLASVREQLENNPRLREDFPDACLVPPASRRPQVWRRNEIVTGNGVKVSALGSGTKIRGRRHNQARPGLIVADDIENETMVRSPEQREQLAHWFNGTLLKAGDAMTNVLVVGTILHHDSLLATLTDTLRSPGWQSRIYRAIEQMADNEPLWEQWRSIYTGLVEDAPSGPAAAEQFFHTNRDAMLAGTRVLWPERESYEQLMIMRLIEGQASFDAEKQNHPVDPERAIFRERDLVFWDDHHIGEAELLVSLRGPLAFYAACDPSLGRLGRHNDDTAIIVVVRDKATGVLYVLEADITKRTPNSTIEHLIELGKRRSFTHVGIETNQFQHFLADELTRRSNTAGLCLPVRKITHTSDKLGRIQSLQPLVVNGTLRFSRKHRKLMEQLIQFPFAAHDDGPDALALAVEVVRQPVCYVTDLDALARRRANAETPEQRMARLLYDDNPRIWKNIARW